MDFGALWDMRRNVIQPITDWNKNQNLGGLKIQAMGIFLQASVLGETDLMNDFKYQYLHFVNSPSTDQTYMTMVQTNIFRQFLKTNFHFVEWGCHWYNVCQWHPCYIITYRCTLFCWIASWLFSYPVCTPEHIRIGITEFTHDLP